jgi:sucrose-6-phosphate hydrolase SacC (GH32 family)
MRAELIEIHVEFEPIDATEVVLNIRDAMIIYDTTKQELSVAGHRASAPQRNSKQRLTILCDRTGLEVFASDGLCYVPMPFNLNPANLRISLETRSGKALITSLQVHELRSAWH